MALAARAARVGLDPWLVLAPGDPARRLITEALLMSAEHAAGQDRDQLADAIGDRVAQALTETIAAVLGAAKG